jgi:DNA adenine methylase
MAIFPTPFRYPGGKTKLSPYVSGIFVENNLLDGHYVEPYCGGSGLAFSLLFNGYARYLHLNDLDRSIYATWYCILNETEQLCRYIQDVSVNMAEWAKQKEVQRCKSTSDLFSLGVSTLFLNRANRSGVIGGGVIGGNDQQGNYKIDARFNKETLIAQIQKIAFYKRRIQLSNLDAKDFLLGPVSDLPLKTLINADPPYYVKGQALYKNSYKHDDHRELSDIIPALKQFWIVTYDNVEPIKSLYSQYTPLEFQLTYSVNKKYKGKEILIADPRLKLPHKEILDKVA